MTRSISHEVLTRRAKAPAREKRDLLTSLEDAIEAELERSKQLRWPSPKYRYDPISFAKDILGADPWSKQIEILEAVRDHDRVAVKSGHKVSKSHSSAILALWFYCSHEDARVVMTSTTSRQVDKILWREVKMLRSRGGRCLACKLSDPDNRMSRPCPHSALIYEEPGELARTGLKSPDFREIVGFTAREAEAVAGVSGSNLMYIVDEASGVSDEIFEAIEGNRAGGAKIVLFSNPTRTSGEFFAAFTSKKSHYKTITISSEDTPNVREGKRVIPGLATREWINEKREEWGEDSALYRVRVRGEFAAKEDGKIFSIHSIAQAEQRWEDTPETGRLYIGIDPAGASGSSDESGFAVRRGLKLVKLFTVRGLGANAIVQQAVALMAEHRLPRETPVVVFDREGPIGAELFGTLRSHLNENRSAFELVAIRASDAAVRQPKVYGRMRDELTANLESWFRDGGAIVEDAKLAGELHEMEWSQSQNGKLKVTPKDDIRKKLHRSPDRYDALALSCWEPLSLRASEEKAATESKPEQLDPYSGGSLNPYAGVDPYGSR